MYQWYRDSLFEAIDNLMSHLKFMVRLGSSLGSYYIDIYLYIHIIHITLRIWWITWRYCVLLCNISGWNFVSKRAFLFVVFQVDFSEFSRFYDFVFFICRENGQRNICKSVCRSCLHSWDVMTTFCLDYLLCGTVDSCQQSCCCLEARFGWEISASWPVVRFCWGTFVTICIQNCDGR